MLYKGESVGFTRILSRVLPLLLVLFILLGCGDPEPRWGRMNSTTSESIRLVQPVSGDTAIAVTFRTGRVLRTVDGGRNWIGFGEFSPRRVEAIHAGINGDLLIAGYGPSILISSDGGEIWGRKALPSTAMLFDIATLPDGRYYAVGKHFASGPPESYATMIDTTTQGWVDVDLPYTEPTLATAVHGGKVYVSFGGMIQSYDPSDSTWHFNYGSIESGDIILDMAFSGNSGLAVGKKGLILVTNNGGRSWKSTSSMTDQDLFAVEMSANEAWICGDGGLWHRRSTSGSFKAVPLTHHQGRLWDLAMINGQPVAVGDGGMIAMPVKN